MGTTTTKTATSTRYWLRSLGICCALITFLMISPNRLMASDCVYGNIASWPIDTCVADSTFWNGFTSNLGPSACPVMTTSILKRSFSDNSCAPSRLSGDGVALSVNDWDGDEYQMGSSKALTFEVRYQAGEIGAIHDFSFWERAPLTYLLPSGDTAQNDRPQKFGLRVLRNECEIFRQVDIATASDWAQQTFDFAGNAGFVFDGSEFAYFVFELYAYDDSNPYFGIYQEVWELDDFQVNGTCGPCPPPVISCPTDAIASWSVDTCVAGTSFWDSFTAELGPASCAGTNASMLDRTTSGNNCTPSRPTGDGFAFTTSNWESDTFTANSSDAVRFTIDYAANDQGEIGELCFWESAPLNYLLSSGASGANDRPQKFGLRVEKNGVEIFSQLDVSTSLDWTQQCFDFTGESDFQFSGPTNFMFELYAYETSDTTGLTEEIWYLDDLQLFGKCNDCLSSGVDSVDVSEDLAAALDLLANDFSVAGFDTSTFTLVTAPPPLKGSTLNNGDGSITFTSALNYCGKVDPIDYQVMDLLGNVITGRAVVNVKCVDDPIEAVDDAISVKQDTTTLLDFLSNDIDVDGDLDPSTLIVLTTLPSSQGTITNNGDGTITFVPDSVYTGIVDPVSYQVSDTVGNTSSAIANIIVSLPPMANDDVDTTTENIPLVIDLAANDFDVDGDLIPSSLFILTSPTPAQGVVINNGDGTITFVPSPGFTGAVNTFYYQISDKAGSVALAAVNIYVTPSSIPMAADDSAFVCNGGSTITDVIANDTDSFSTLDPESVTVLSGPSNGTAIANGDGTITYTHDGSATTADSYTYYVLNQGGIPGAANVSITILDGLIANSVTVIDATECNKRNGGVFIDLDDAISGTPPYHVMINGGAFMAGPFTSEPITVIGAPGGVSAWGLTVTDANGCAGEFGALSVGGPSNPRVDTIDFQTIECGDLGGDIAIEILDLRPGTPPYTIEVNPGGLTYGPFTADPILLDDVPFGSYANIKITDADGCIVNKNQSFNLVEPLSCSECPTPVNLATLVNGGKTADLSWDSIPEATGYGIRIRAVGDTTWVNIPPQSANWRRVGSLSILTQYEWQVRSFCGTEIGDWSALETFTTMDHRIAAPVVSVEVYPNPASEGFSVNLASTYSESVDIQIRVYDQIGRLILSQLEVLSTGVNTYHFDSSNLVDGIYEVVVHQEGAQKGVFLQSEKLIIQK